ncbi:poly-gamma-glutamate synthase PgsB [bacterium]|nr:poly-gamma-glutamate synthase PgsB [bacterium]
MLVIVLLTAILVGFGAYEFAMHRNRVNSIPVRIHVNGTRGKSSVTRLIAAGLRAGGVKTVAKVTGTLPRIIDERGWEIPITRLHPVNIIEQTKVFRFFEKHRPRAIVIECMAVQPEYQWICEHQFVKSTIGVMTNARMDHVREMGPSIENIANSLSNTISEHGPTFTSENRNDLIKIMRDRADEVGGELRVVSAEEVTDQDLRNFKYIEHRSNVALSLRICEEVGVDRQTALEGMTQMAPDPGALKVSKVVHESGRRLLFLNALAANDPESTLFAWERAWTLYPDSGMSIILLNTRHDRFDRSVQLVETMARYMKFDLVISMGESTELLQNQFRRFGISLDKVKRVGVLTPEKAWETIWDLVEDEALVFAMGNAGHGGLAIAEMFQQRREKE